MSDPSHVDPRTARRALLADLEALRDSLAVTADEHVPILDDVVTSPAPGYSPETTQAPEPAAPDAATPAPAASRLQVDRLFDDRWRANTDRLVSEARARVASLRGAANAEAADDDDAELVQRVRARLESDLKPALAEMIDAELDALRSALMYRLQEQVEQLITRVLASRDATQDDRQHQDNNS